MRSLLRFRLCYLLAAPFGLFALEAPAVAGLPQWQGAVAAGTPAGYVNTNITSPIVADIGTYSETTGGGVTYEFIVNATNEGASSALMGAAQNPAGGDRAGLKFEQWPDSLTYGTTAFGVADFDSGVPNAPGVDTHVVFVNNSVNTLLYVNGAFAATILNSSPTLSGLVGIGQVYNGAAAAFDPLTGTILGVAVYDAALPANEIAAHAQAFAAVPEPAALAIALVAGCCIALRSRASRSAA
ncbi:MAG: hypothetical protein DCC67_06965 [Planctomycetota bacterium]|nr:MAG: hypothetical protein DCC67_06965 [Planctomycetota bacterium]